MISTLTKSDAKPGPTFRGGFGFALHDVARLVRRRFDAQAQRHHMTLPQWRLLGQLSKTDGLSQVALAGLIDADPMTLSGMVERMETKGLIERVPDPADSRAKLVRITPKSRALVDEMKALAEEVFAQAFEGISDEEKAIAFSVLTRISANLTTQRAPAKDEKEEETL